MKQISSREAEHYGKERKRKKRWVKIVTLLAAVVVFCTTYALILPAITMENACPIPEHTHTLACYTPVPSVTKTEPICTPELLELHEHTAKCYNDNRELVCGYADYVVHTHDDNCRDEAGNLWCKLPEIEEHTHETSCYSPAKAAHTHNSDCYDKERGALICGMEEAHVHGESCKNEAGEIICGMGEGAGHTHNDDCYEWSDVLACELSTEATERTLRCDEPEVILHVHEPYVSAKNPGCYDETGALLICGLMQTEAHQHTAECFKTIEETVDPEALNCALDHEHTELCYGAWELTCELAEHTHDEACTSPNDAAAYYCGKEVHTHGDGCYDESGELTCILEEHAHDASCMLPDLAEADALRVKKVIAMIDELPELAEIEAAMEEYEQSGTGNFEEIAAQVRYVYCYYEDLGETLQQSVTNRDKLLALSWLYSAETLELTDTVKIYQVNQYNNALNVLVYSDTAGKTIRDIMGSGMYYTAWDAIIVENQDGLLRVTQVNTDEVVKVDTVVPENGFIALVYNSKVSVSVGDYVTADFNYMMSHYNADGLGTLIFSDTPQIKAEKNNEDKLDQVKGADTRNIIEVNLYDYGSNINDKYHADQTYPGYQQEYGQLSVSSIAHSNFGNNITKDLGAGKLNVTNNAIAQINKIANGANSPISGAMKSTLSDDGYPVLANGKKLDYLWKDGTYAKKQNSQSINGLFRYNETTGAYTFNSRTNHAQFNPGNDTFTLYKQVITSNVFWYPFGNFLPFNDIVHESAQASTMDRAYLQTIANTAALKYNSGKGGDYYKNLSDSMNKWIGLMDQQKDWGTNWNAADAINAYFRQNAPSNGNSKFDIRNDKNVDLNNIYSIDFDEATDFFFGMEMKMNFMQPKDGLTGKSGKEKMVFEFTGDDDVWVYIDGKLVLDLSGIHRHVGGKIDFTTGKVSYQSLDVSTGDVGAADPTKENTTFKALGLDVDAEGRLKDYSTHSFNFYYMERGAGSGVCRMNFNFPLLHKNSISVSKELSVDDESKLPLLGNPDFRFQVLREDGNTLFIEPNTEYKILDSNGTSVGTGKTDANGVFTIKANQTAVFENIPETAGKYFVRELLDQDVFEQYGKINVSGSSVTTNYDVTIGSDSFKGVNSPVKDVSDGATIFQFENGVTTSKLGSLEITKKLTKPAEDKRNFRFHVTLDGEALPVGTPYTVGTETRTVAEAGIIPLSQDETAIIPNILAGTKWTVQEEANEDYSVSYLVNGTAQETPSGVVGIAQRVSIVVENDERGATVSIPVKKTLAMPDGLSHSYTLLLEQVTDETGKTAVTPAYQQELPLTLTEETSGSFTISYLQTSLGTLPKDFYYKITERRAEEDLNTRYDDTVYVVKVTVEKSAEGNLTAAITGAWKDGIAAELTDFACAFENRLVYYELPKTGGGGTLPYTVGGALLMAAAGLLLLTGKKRRKES